MKIAKIKWVKRFEEDLAGMVNDNLMFIISKRGVKKIKFVLQSYPFKNDVFANANNYRNLLITEDIQLAKKTAQEKLDEFVKTNFLTKSVKPKRKAIGNLDSYPTGDFNWLEKS
jgi:hypothetical protein